MSVLSNYFAIQMPGKRPRVSILNLLLITTIVALLIVVVRLYQELDHERSLRLQLLQKGGILEVTDLDLVHVVQVDNDGSDGNLSWRVYVPQKRSVTLNGRLDTIPADKEIVPRLPPNAIVVGDRSPSSPVELVPGEHVVILSWAFDSQEFTLNVVGNGTRKGRGVSLPDRNWVWDVAHQMDITHVEHTPKTLQSLQNRQTLTLQDGKAFVLVRHQYTTVPRYTEELAKRGNKMPEPKVGELLVWLHPDG
jgi:hypothetical protein